MKTIILGEDKKSLEKVSAKIEKIPGVEEVKGFDDVSEALRFVALLAGKNEQEDVHIKVRTFGNFDVFVDGHMIAFKRARAKELLAYLVDRQGASVTRAEAFAAMWEDEEYDRSAQKQFDVVVRTFKTALAEVGISEILEIKSGYMRVLPEYLECDMYRFFEGDETAVKAYRGEYMSAYPWAEMTEAYMDQSRILGME